MSVNKADFTFRSYFQVKMPPAIFSYVVVADEEDDICNITQLSIEYKGKPRKLYNVDDVFIFAVRVHFFIYTMSHITSFI